jgi:hypothetical protein
VANNVPDASADANEARPDASTEADARPAGGGGSHIAFITSGTFTGGEASDDRYGEAIDGGLLAGRTFRALLSYPDAGAISRLADYGPWVSMSDGGQIAKRADNLLSMDRAILIDEDGRTFTGIVSV